MSLLNELDNRIKEALEQLDAFQGTCNLLRGVLESMATPTSKRSAPGRVLTVNSKEVLNDTGYLAGLNEPGLEPLGIRELPPSKRGRKVSPNKRWSPEHRKRYLSTLRRKGLNVKAK